MSLVDGVFMELLNLINSLETRALKLNLNLKKLYNVHPEYKEQCDDYILTNASFLNDLNKIKGKLKKAMINNHAEDKPIWIEFVYLQKKYHEFLVSVSIKSDEKNK